MMSEERTEAHMEIKRDPRGFYSLWIDGRFEGNYDTYTEAAKAYEEIEWGETLVRELVSA